MTLVAEAPPRKTVLLEGPAFAVQKHIAVSIELGDDLGNGSFGL
jgi:hypothetical protein